MKTTMKKIWSFDPCAAGWDKHVRQIGFPELTREYIEFKGTQVIPEVDIAIKDVLDINGIYDALWVLRSVFQEYKREILSYIVWYAAQVQHLMADPKSIDALNVVYRYINGHASIQELDEAREIARKILRSSKAKANRAALKAENLGKIAHEARDNAEKSPSAANLAKAAVAVRSAKTAAQKAKQLARESDAARAASRATDAARTSDASRAVDAVRAADDAEEVDYSTADEQLVDSKQSALLLLKKRKISELRRMIECVEQGMMYDIISR
jgi:hypothetical protein